MNGAAAFRYQVRSPRAGQRGSGVTISARPTIERFAQSFIDFGGAMPTSPPKRMAPTLLTQLVTDGRPPSVDPPSVDWSSAMRSAAILSSLVLAWSVLPAAAETVVRYGISLADIPLTTGQPDRGAGAYQFTGPTIS